MKLPAWREAQIARDIGPRPNRRPRNVAWVLAQLQGGAVLHSGRVGDNRWWMLSDGTVLTGNTAKAVISDPRVVGCGDALFTGVLAQTFRFLEEPKGEATHE
jgi:hypothetical protein